MNDEQAGNDLDYLRAVAEAGQRSPLLGGDFALWWGSLSAIVLFCHWLIIIQAIPIGFGNLWILWVGYVVLGSAGSAWIGRRYESKPAAGSHVNRAASAVWSSGGISLLTVLTGLLAPQQFNVMLPAALLVYSVGWLTSARLCDDRLLYLPAFVSLAGVFIAGALMMSHWVYPATALVLLASTVLPGLWLQQRERAARNP